MGDRVAVVGVGLAHAGRDTGRSFKQLTVEAAQAAMTDAGMGPDDIDGNSLRSYDQPEPWGEPPDMAMDDRSAAHMLGTRPMRWMSSTGTTFAELAMSAIAGIRAGFCHTCIVLHPCRTQRRRGGPAASQPMRAPGDFQFMAPFGPPGPGSVAGLVKQRRMSVYGTTDEQFGMQQVAQRHHASLNEQALFREPLTVDDYLASRWVSRPLHLLDCDYPCDTNGAVIFTTEDRAAGWRPKPVFVEAASSAVVDSGWDYLDDMLEGALVPCAQGLWARTDLTPADVDCAQLYDGFSVITLGWMEALGFCGVGEAGDFVAGGHTRLGGSLPVNTDGGVCNVGRHHGSSHLIEAVRQLRGECGDRQVPDVEVSLYTVAYGPHAHATLLTAS